MFYCFISFGYLPGTPLQQREPNDITEPLGVQPSAHLDIRISMTHCTQKIILDVLYLFSFNHVIRSCTAGLSSW
jgi:hypothetical protein